MSLSIVDHGQRNRVEADADSGNGTIVFEGDDNLVVLGAGTSMDGGTVRLGHACRFLAAAQCALHKIDVFAIADAEITIGLGSQFTWFTRLYAHEPGVLRIGERCLFASETILSNSDVHAIFDTTTGARLNPARDVIVEDGVWIAEGARLHKGAYVGRGSVVGAQAVVTRRMPAHCLVAGNPARVLREGIRWRP